MRLFKGFASFALVCGAAFSLAGCGGSSNQTASQPTVTGITVAPTSTSLAPGQTQALTVTATESSGATVPLTDGLTFTSDNTAVATVSATGVVTAASTAGTAHIAVTAVVGVNNVVTAPTPATIVVSIPLTSIALSPLSATIAAGATQQLTVTGTYANNSTAVLPASGETFASSDTTVATVDGTGLVTVVANATPGKTATISATDTASKLTTSTANSTVITVAAPPPTLASIALSPLTANVVAGKTVQLSVIGTESNGTTTPLPASGETFTSLNPGVATVDATGLVTVGASATPGQTATITAKDTASGLGTSTADSTVITVVSPVASVGNVYSNGALDTGVTFVPFGGSVNSPLPAVDPTTLFTDNTPALKIVVTGAAGAYSGGAFVAAAPRDLSSFNALTFWAKANKTQSTLKVQLGNDGGAGANVNYQVESIGLPLTTSWQQFVIPLPDPAKANGIDGLISFADANNNYTFWLADVQYLAVPASVLGTGTVAGDGFSAVGLNNTTTPPSLLVASGSTFQIPSGTNSLTWTLGTGMLNGSPVVPLPNGGNLDNDAWRWFTLSSSTTNATVSVDGLIKGVSAGTATIKGTLAGVPIPNNVPVTVTAPQSTPTTAPATPTVPAANAVAVFDSSGVYTPLASVNLNENWCGGATEAPFAIPGTTPAQSVALYNWSNTCDGIGWEANPINATSLGLTNFHVDLWSPTAGPLTLRLVDAGGSQGNYTVPAIPANTWTSVDVPLSSFTGLTAETAIQQLGLIGPAGYTVYVDNIYLYKASSSGGGGGATAPTASPPAPTATTKAALYSPTYGATVAAPVWSYNVGFCGANTYAPYSISGGDQVLQYGVNSSAPCFAWADKAVGGSVGANIDVSAFSTLHVDIWTPATPPPVIDIGVVDFTGSPIRTDYYISYGSGVAAACVPSAWCSLEIPVSSGSPLSPNKAIGQLLLVAQATKGNNITTGSYTFYIDNVYYH